jgi:indole-3-glycerol phosphate synthase
LAEARAFGADTVLLIVAILEVPPALQRVIVLSSSCLL